MRQIESNQITCSKDVLESKHFTSEITVQRTTFGTKFMSFWYLILRSNLIKSLKHKKIKSTEAHIDGKVKAQAEKKTEDFFKTKI